MAGLLCRSCAAVALAGLVGEVLLVLVLFAAVGVGIGRRLALAGDVGPVVVGVDAVQIEPGFRLGVGVRHDGLRRDLRFADAADYAPVGVHQQLVLALLLAAQGADPPTLHIF